MQTKSRLLLAAISATVICSSNVLAQSFTAETQGRIELRSGPPGAETAPIWGYLALPPGPAARRRWC